MQLQSEVKEIFADLREHLLYMQELGIERVAVELPEQVLAASDDDVPPFDVTPRVVEQRRPEPVVERYVPPEVAKVERPVQPPPAPRTSGGSRISALPSLSSRKPMPRKATKTAREDSGTGPKAAEQPVVSSNVAAGEPAGSLFGAMAELPESNETIEQIRADIGNCTRCPLYEGRTQIVHSTGNLQAELMFVGEAPGADEDAQGFPFVGRAGQLLTKIIESIGFKREDVFIGNINRCRPPGNRAPTIQEAHTCRPFLQREIAVVRPKVIVVLGNTALHNLLDTKIGITKLRGEFQDYKGVKVMPPFHPAFLLRDPRKKREVWEDMKKVRDYLKSPT
jgi:DNA polymerase